MIAEIEQPAIESDEPPVGFVQFDLTKMNYAELVEFKSGTQSQQWYDALLDRVVIGGLAAIPVAYMGYALGDLITEVNERASPKVRSLARPSSDSDVGALPPTST